MASIKFFPIDWLRPHPLMGAIAPIVLWGVATPEAIAQVTNQSDVTGTNPDVIYSVPADFSGLAENPGFVQLASDLAVEIGDAYEACVAFYETKEALCLEDCNPCAHLDDLLQQADQLLTTSDQQWQDYREQIRDLQLW